VVAYHCINGFLLPLIYCLIIIIIVEMIMLFWQVCKVAIFKNLSWFSICLGWSLVLPCLYCHITNHCGIQECPNQLWRNVGPSWLAILRFHTIGTIFLVISKDHYREQEFFPVQHTWIWNSLLIFFGVPFISFLCLSSLTLVCDI